MRRRWSIVLLLTAFFIACDDGEDPPPEEDMGPVQETFAVAFDATDLGALLSVWGPTDDEVWAVGGQPEDGVIWRFDGTAWQDAQAPAGPLFNWVHGAGDVRWFVGNGGRIVRKTGAGDFEDMPSPTQEPLWGVFAVSADEAWAVGGEAIDDGTPDEPVIVRWKDGNWAQFPLPEIDRDFRALFKVWGTGPDDVYAVGAKGVILHWNGSAWAQQGSGTGEDLISLFGVGDDIAIVGGRGNGILARKTVDGWDAQTLAGNPGFNGIWMAPDGTSWIAGNRGSLLSVPAGSFEPIRHRSGTQEVLHGMWGTPAGRRIAVGGSLDSGAPWIGVAVEAP